MTGLVAMEKGATWNSGSQLAIWPHLIKWDLAAASG